MSKAKAFKPSDEVAPFFDFGHWGTVEPEPAVIEATQRYKHNGKTATKDEERCFRIVESLLQGVSKRRTAKIHGVSRHTVDGIVLELERQGKLAPLKERLKVKFGQVIEASAEAVLDAIDEGKLPPNVLPIVAGVFSDKKALLDGEPTAIVGHLDVKPVTAASLNDMIAGLASCKAEVIEIPAEAATDLQSDDKTKESQ